MTSFTINIDFQMCTSVYMCMCCISFVFTKDSKIYSKEKKCNERNGETKKLHAIM